MAEVIRQPAVAGRFYTADPDELKQQINGFLEKARPEKPDGEIIGIISPHAGYFYSGQVAAYGFELLEKNQFDTVIVVAPSHHTYFEGCSIYNLGGYQTPLGVIPLDSEIIERMRQAESSIKFHKSAHLEEHSLEVQLPFLQEILGDFKLVPIVMGQQTRENWTKLAKAMAGSINGKRILLLGSSDLSHFYQYEKAVSLDTIILDHINNYDIDGFWDDIEAKKCAACGAGPIASVMQASQLTAATHARVLNYANSGDVSGDRNRVVGYMSAVFYREH